MSVKPYKKSLFNFKPNLILVLSGYAELDRTITALLTEQAVRFTAVTAAELPQAQAAEPSVQTATHYAVLWPEAKLHNLVGHMALHFNFITSEEPSNRSATESQLLNLTAARAAFTAEQLEALQSSLKKLLKERWLNSPVTDTKAA